MCVGGGMRHHLTVRLTLKNVYSLKENTLYGGNQGVRLY